MRNMIKLASVFPELQKVFLHYDRTLTHEDIAYLMDEVFEELQASKQVRYSFLIKTIHLALTEPEEPRLFEE